MRRGHRWREFARRRRSAGILAVGREGVGIGMGAYMVEADRTATHWYSIFRMPPPTLIVLIYPELPPLRFNPNSTHTYSCVSAGVENWVDTCGWVWKSWSQLARMVAKAVVPGSSDGDRDRDGIVVHVCNVVGNGKLQEGRNRGSCHGLCSSFKSFDIATSRSRTDTGYTVLAF